MTPDQKGEIACAMPDLSAVAALIDQWVEEARVIALREAADDWDRDDAEHIKDLCDLADREYQIGGPSMPAIWLRRRADRIDGGAA